MSTPGDVLLVATHSTVPNRDGPGTLLGNVGELAMKRFGDEFESVVGQVDPFPLGQARLELAEDVDLSWGWIGLLGTLHVITASADVESSSGRLLSAMEAALQQAVRRGARSIITPVQRGGWRMHWQTALGRMVDAADRVADATTTMVIVERSAKRFRSLAELAPSYGIEVASRLDSADSSLEV